VDWRIVLNEKVIENEGMLRGWKFRMDGMDNSEMKWRHMMHCRKQESEKAVRYSKISDTWSWLDHQLKTIKHYEVFSTSLCLLDDLNPSHPWRNREKWVNFNNKCCFLFNFKGLKITGTESSFQKKFKKSLLFFDL